MSSEDSSSIKMEKDDPTVNMVPEHNNAVMGYSIGTKNSKNFVLFMCLFSLQF